MASRSFRANDGTPWTAWLVQAGTANVPGMPSQWLAFQNEEGTERRRLMQVVAGWEQLSDERLDLLRRMAEPVVLFVKRHSPPDGIARNDALRGEGER